jgi:hypothetical protein
MHTSMCDDDSLPEIVRSLPEGNAASAYALVFFHLGVPERDAILAFENGAHRQSHRASCAPGKRNR